MLMVYTGQRLFKLNWVEVEKNVPRIQWMQTHIFQVRILFTIGFLGTVYYGIPLVLDSLYRFLLLSGTGLISIFYVVRIQGRNLREIPFLKIFAVVFTFFFVACLLPFENGLSLKVFLSKNLINGLFLSANLLYIFGITILFDLPDMSFDDPAQKTIPQILGPKKSFWLSVFLVSCVFVYFLLSGAEFYWWILFLTIHVLFYGALWKFKYRLFFLPIFGEMLLLLMGLFYFLLRFY